MYSKALHSAGLTINLQWLQFGSTGQSETRQKSAVLSGKI